MCGRFALIVDPEQLAAQFDVEVPPQMADRYNIAPTQPVAAVRLGRDGSRELTHFHWGLIPSWSKDTKMSSRMINARGETVAEKPSFRAAFKRRRCLIPASGFYEWQKTSDGKQPTFIHPADGVYFGLAGLWETWHAPDGGEIDSCTIITTTPNELMAPIHNRMPVIIDPADYDAWLQPEEKPNVGLHLIRPFSAETMDAYPISTLVNKPSNDHPAILDPIA